LDDTNEMSQGVDFKDKLMHVERGDLLLITRMV